MSPRGLAPGESSILGEFRSVVKKHKDGYSVDQDSALGRKAVLSNPDADKLLFQHEISDNYSPELPLAIRN